MDQFWTILNNSDSFEHMFSKTYCNMDPFRKNRKTVIYHRHLGFFLKKSWMGIEWSQNHTATWRWRADTPTTTLQHKTSRLNTLLCLIERLASTKCVWLAQVSEPSRCRFKSIGRPGDVWRVQMIFKIYQNDMFFFQKNLENDPLQLGSLPASSY